MNQKHNGNNGPKLYSLTFFFIILFSSQVEAGDQFNCLLQDNISDTCLQSIDVDKVIKIQPQLAGYICTVMTMKMRDQMLNSGVLPLFADKAEKLCQNVGSKYLANGYNLFQIHLMKDSLVSALKVQYQLFFRAPFNHENQLAQLLPKHQQILENRLKKMKASSDDLGSSEKIDLLILYIYLEKNDEAYTLYQSKETPEIVFPDQVIYDLFKARILEKNQQFSQALTFITSYIARNQDKTHWYFYHLQGNFEMHHLQFKKALVSFEKSLNQNKNQKDFSFTPYNMGLCYQKISDFQNSLTFLKRALIADPESSEILNSIGFSYYQLMHQTEKLEQSNKYEKAATQYFKQAISKNQNYSVPYYNYGMLLYDRGHFQSASKMFKKAIEHKIDFQSAKYAMFKALYVIEKKKGLKYMSENLATGIQFSKDLGILLYQVGEHDKAYDFIKDAITLKKNLDQVYEWKGIIEFHLDNLSEAQTSFKLAIDYGNKNPSVYFNIGYVNRLHKRYEQAIEYFQKSHALKESKQCLEQINDIKAQIARQKKVQQEEL